jgi:hypothetical protein
MMPLSTIQFMTVEFTRLACGLIILTFHRQIADWVMEQERALVVLFRQRGVPVPAAPTTETGRNIYFLVGTFVVLYEIIRIWLMLHPLR